MVSGNGEKGVLYAQHPLRTHATCNKSSFSLSRRLFIWCPYAERPLTTMDLTPVQIGQFILGKNLGIGAFGKVRSDRHVGRHETAMVTPRFCFTMGTSMAIIFNMTSCSNLSRCAIFSSCTDGGHSGDSCLFHSLIFV